VRRAPAPRLDHLVVSVRRPVGVPLRRGVVLVAEQRLQVVQRHAILIEELRCGGGSMLLDQICSWQRLVPAWRSQLSTRRAHSRVPN
jgi:hypothetical protein